MIRRTRVSMLRPGDVFSRQDSTRRMTVVRVDRAQAAGWYIVQVKEAHQTSLHVSNLVKVYS